MREMITWVLLVLAATLMILASFFETLPGNPYGALVVAGAIISAIAFLLMLAMPK